MNEIFHYLRGYVIERNKNQTFGLHGINTIALLIVVLTLSMSYNTVFGANAKFLIKGIVTDASDNSAIPGVNILEKGTSKGVITDVKGQFSIEVSKSDAILVFSYIGYSSLEIKVNGRSNIQVSMKEDQQNLQEVVVVGYGSVKRSDLTGAVSSVRMKDVEDMPLVSADQILQGRTAGVFIGSGGGPGAPIDIRVRGTNSVNAGSQPLYVIDGVPLDLGDTGSPNGTYYGASGNVNILSTLNPNDIASMEVLKDASATAIYGSRGSNGVILITTKSGLKGKAKIEVDYYNTQSWASKKLDMMDASEYAQMHYEYALKTNSVGKYDPYIYGTNVNTDWQDAIFRQSTSQNFQVRISGGTDNVKYNVSSNYQDNEGIIINSYLKKLNNRVNLEFLVTPKLKVVVNANISSVTDSWASGVNQGVDVSKALLYAPTVPVKDSIGNWGEMGRVINTTNINQNMVAIQQGTKLSRNNLILVGNVYANYTIIKGLDLKIQYGASQNSAHNKSYFPQNVWFGGMWNGYGISNESLSQSSTLTGQLTYQKLFAKIHRLNVTAVCEYSNYNRSSSEFQVSNFFTDQTSYNNLGLGAMANSWSSGGIETNRLSYLGRINYTLKDRYLFTLSSRADGSSKFGTDHKWGFFPSAAFAWRMSEEKFIKNLSVFSNLKFRSSYGVSGNDRIGDYLSKGYMTTSPYALNGGIGTALNIANMENPGLRWESTEQTNFGLDLGFFKNRLSLTLDYYQKNTSNLLLKSSPSLISGQTSYTSNKGGMRINGFEFSVSSKNIVSNDFDWSTDFNISMDKGVVTNLGGLPPYIILGSTGAVAGAAGTDILAKVEEGARLNNLYGLVQDGVLQPGYQDLYQYRHMAQQTKYYGDLNFKDLNGDGKLNQDDIAVIGNANPDFYFGINNSVSYKNWKLIVFMQGSVGNDKIYLLNKQFNLNPMNNSFRELWENRWTEYNPSNYYPNVGYNNTLSSWSLKDASYLRLQSVSISYNVPVKKWRQFKLSSLRVYATGTNLYTLTSYPGYNPADSQSDNLIKGFDTGGYPLSASVTGGISLSF